MTLICTICARGGSKGVVGKNVRELLGKPLLAWTIEQARQTGLFEANTGLKFVIPVARR